MNSSRYYVRRDSTTGVGGVHAWVGPFRTAAAADRETLAWRECGHEACSLLATPEVRERVRAWERAVKAARVANRSRARVRVLGRQGAASFRPGPRPREAAA
jgi:hypothetical protein